MACIDSFIHSFIHSSSVECVPAAFLFSAGLVCLREPLFLSAFISSIGLGSKILKRSFEFLKIGFEDRDLDASSLLILALDI